jgi:ribonuclease HI
MICDMYNSLLNLNYAKWTRAIVFADAECQNSDHLVEEIRKRKVTLNKKKRKIEFKWVKAHAGMYGNRSTCD